MTAIEWTDATWNPVTGCDRVSPGCANCYALTLAKRLQAMGVPGYERDGDPRTSGPGFAVSLHPDRLEQPLRWRRPRMVFVNSMSDLFHEAIPDRFVAAVFDVMRQCPQHTFQILTKRPERARDWFTGWSRAFERFRDSEWPLANVWLGVSIENARYTYRADVLREIPAAVRFISAEPLLASLYPNICGNSEGLVDGPCILDAGHRGKCTSARVPAGTRQPLDLSAIDWLIVGGESGPRHRPLNLEHARELRDACAATPGTAFFFKQVGGRTPKSGGALLDGREHRDFPRVAVAA